MNNKLFVAALFLFSACVSVKKAESVLLESGQAAAFCAANFPSPILSSDTAYIFKAADNTAYVDSLIGLLSSKDSVIQYLPANATPSERIALINRLPRPAPDTITIKITETTLDSAALKAQRIRADKAERKITDISGRLTGWRTAFICVMGALIICIAITIFIIKK